MNLSSTSHGQHMVLKTVPGAAIFGQDMMFDIPYIADWTDIGKRRQALVDQNNARENKRRIDFGGTESPSKERWYPPQSRRHALRPLCYHTSAHERNSQDSTRNSVRAITH